MSPNERIRLPFRWQFVPVRDERDGAIRWSWRAYAQSGKQAHQSGQSFDTLSECMADARAHGYID